MKRYNMTELKFLSICAALFVLSLSICGAAPIISVDKDAIEGICTYGTKKPFEFIVKNVGNENLVIDKLIKSCGCASAEIERKIIPPGKDTKIIGTYQPNPLKETFSVSVSVKSNAKNEPIKRLTISGRNFPPDIELSHQNVEIIHILGYPPKIVPISIKTKGIINPNHIRFIPKDKNVSPIKYDTNVNYNTQDGECFAKIQLQCIENLDLGKYEGEIKADVLIDKKEETITLPVTVNVVSEFKIFPKQIEITPIESIKNYSYRVFIKHRASKVISVDSVECKNKSISIKVNNIPNEGVFLFFEIPNEKRYIGKTEIVQVRIKIEEIIETIDIPIIIHDPGFSQVNP